MTKEEAIGIWLPMVLLAVQESPQCEEAVKMAARALSAEPNTGHWIWDKTEKAFLCDCCGSGYKNQPTIMGKPMFVYCPLCGTKMQEVVK